MAGQPDLWTAPRPASDEELNQHTLPVDVRVGNTVFRSGTPLLLIVNQHRALYAQVYKSKEELL
jgi:hypothetical protein